MAAAAAADVERAGEKRVGRQGGTEGGRELDEAGGQSALRRGRNGDSAARAAAFAFSPIWLRPPLPQVSPLMESTYPFNLHSHFGVFLSLMRTFKTPKYRWSLFTATSASGAQMLKPFA